MSMPALIAGDDRAQFSMSVGATNVVIDNVDAQGIWRKSQEHQSIQTTKLEGAHIFNDRWQAGLSIPILSREFVNQKYSGLGDISTSLAYEYLSDWNYNPYRPKAIAFLQLRFPTGKARADSEVGGLDSRGNGFLAPGVGTMLIKAWGRVDVFSVVEIHRAFAKNISNSLIEVGGGYNWSKIRAGLSLSESYEEPINIEMQNGIQRGGAERYGTVTALISYLPSEDWSWIFSYTDQTVVGTPTNTSLGQGVAVLLMRRWSR